MDRNVHSGTDRCWKPGSHDDYRALLETSVFKFSTNELSSCPKGKEETA